jgi:hypothetical protein
MLPLPYYYYYPPTIDAAQGARRRIRPNAQSAAA